MTKADVETILKTVMDPELGVNIIDLGLVYDIRCERQGEKGELIRIIMTLTTPGCPLGGYFVDMVKEAVAHGLDLDEHKVMVEITFDPPWSMELMNDEVKAQLGF